MRPKLKFNRSLFWDYDLSETDLERESVLILYLSRALDRGTMEDVRGIPRAMIRKYFDRLHLSSRVRTFWRWYLRIEINEKANRSVRH